MTGKEMCEFIVKSDLFPICYGKELTAEEIWNSSSTGELFQVYEWYDEARLLVGIRDGILY